MPPPYGKKVSIRVLAANTEEEPVPLYVGRDDGTIEKYARAEDADLGRPSLVLRGHRGPVTGILAVNADEIFSSSLDGSIKQWNTAVDPPPVSLALSASPAAAAAAAAEGGNRVVRSLDGAVPLHCLAQQSSNGRLYAGGADGALHVVDGDRRSSWPGHLAPITCVAFTLNDLIVTGSTDGQVVVWDAVQGKPFRELHGHGDAITGVAVVGADEEALAEEEAVAAEAEDTRGGAAPDTFSFGPNFFLSPAAGAIVSFARDGTAKVWAVPDPALDGEGEGGAEEAWMVRSGADGNASEETAGRDDDSGGGGAAVVSFQMPEGGIAVAGVEEQGDGDGDGSGEESEAYRKKRVSFEATPIMTIAADAAGSNSAAAAAAADGEEPMDASSADHRDSPTAPLEPISEILNPAVNPKSALKAPERPLLRKSEALGTIALPAAPHAVFQPPGLGEADDMGEDADGAGSATAGLVYVGSVRGTIWGLQLARMARTVLRFVSANRHRVSREVRATKALQRKSEALLAKTCRKAVKAETDKQVRIAETAHKTKRAAERAKRREERLAAAKAAAAERRRRAAEGDDDEEAEEEEDLFADEEGDEEEEDDDEEADEDFGLASPPPPAADGEGDDNGDGGGVESAFTPSPPVSDFRLRRLTPEQRTALEAFVKEQEKARDAKVAEIQKAVQARLALVWPLAKATYDTTKAEFARLPFTSYASVAPSAAAHAMGGPLPPRGDDGKPSRDGEAVVAVLQARGRVYASQADRVAITRLTPGVIKL